MKTIVLIISFLFSLSGFSQKIILNKADQDYEVFAYVDAVEIYEKVLDKGYRNAEILKKTANSHYFKADYRKAFPYYRRLFRYANDLAPEYYYRYAQTLKSVSRYSEADEILEEFYQMNQSDSRARLAKLQPDYRDNIRANSGLFDIGITTINSQESDYGASYYKDQLVFTSARDTGGIKKRVHRWTNSAFTKLYVADLNPRNKELTNVRAFSESLTTKYHESTPAFTKNGETVYFTRNNYVPDKAKRNQEGTILLKIYRAKFDGNDWHQIEELPFNSDEFNTAHPALSPDENYLYFASDRPETNGKSDLFKVEILEDGSFGEPENLGAKINTSGRESFPFVAHDGKLFFSSDGHPGLGGFDVYVTEFNEEKQTYETPQNLGEPINSKVDDFALVLTKDSTGFFTSKRKSGKFKNDNIYRIKQQRGIAFNCKRKMRPKIYDRDTEEPIQYARIRIYDENYNLLEDAKTDEYGEYVSKADQCGGKYYIRVDKKSYETEEVSIILPMEYGVETVRIPLNKRRKAIQKGKDLKEILHIKEIYFDLDKAKIRPDAEVELAKIVEIMKKYPEMKIEIGSHTDSRQTHEYNEDLSQRRADSTRSWIISQGVDAERIKAKGYGETQLVNECADGVPCSEEKHQENRRSEFIILELDELEENETD
ncbi:MAG: OmpA family protein [Bacteroidota bacterium]